MDLNGRHNEPLDSPTSGDTSRPKRRKVESEKLRESREMEAAAAQLDREEEEAIDAAREEAREEARHEAPGVSPTQRHGGVVLDAEYRDPQVDGKDDKDDAPYQPPAVDGNDANDELQEDNGYAQNDEIYGEYHSDKPPKHALQGTFLKDLIPMMIGFGDDEAPSLDTVEFIEDALVAYSVDILRSALDLSRQRGRMRSTGKPTGPPTAEDIVTVVRKDPRKVARVEELLIMQQEIKVAQDSIEKQEDLETLAIEHEKS